MNISEVSSNWPNIRELSSDWLNLREFSNDWPNIRELFADWLSVRELYADWLNIFRFDMEGAALYSVKWYKGRHEFYRYMPTEPPIIKTFPVKNMKINVSPS